MELVDFVHETITAYNSGDYTDVPEGFELDFIHWTEEHFASLPRQYQKSLMDFLRKHGFLLANPKKHHLSAVLADYIATIRVKIKSVRTKDDIASPKLHHGKGEVTNMMIGSQLSRNIAKRNYS